MTTAATAWLAAAAALAVADWAAVAARAKAVEYAAKPATIAALAGAAVTLDTDDDGRRAAFVVALALSACGDVFLMLRRRRFVAGLAAFLVAHVAYATGFALGGASLGRAALALPLVAAAAVYTRRLTTALRATGRDRLVAPVWAYAVAISAMVVAACASGIAVAVAGALLFALSDGLIGWTSFVRPLAWGPVAIIVAYHAAQAALVVSLAS